MPTLAPELLTELIPAEQASIRNWKRNCRSLAKTQSGLVELLDRTELKLEWVYARDGSLSGLHGNGQWWAACSVPLLASRALLKSLEQGPMGSCLLAPKAAGMVRAARERMGPLGVLMVVQPSAETARMILSCHDFSEEIAAHRLWFSCGENWAGQLRQLLTDYPGLATPVRFIRTKLTTDEVIQPMIDAAQTVFSDILNERSQEIARIKAEHWKHAGSDWILHIGGTQFRLWDFGPVVIQQQLAGRQIRQFDTDDAMCGSPLALVEAATDCGAIVSANLSRGDSDHLKDLDVPWITWLTVGAVPQFSTAGKRDALVLADESWRGLAQAAGWPADRVRVCGWARETRGETRGEPVRERGRETGARGGTSLGFICDTRVIEIPAVIREFSSHRLLWELIEEELEANPFMVEDMDAYLVDRAQQLNIKPDAVDRVSFIELLISPAYQQALARMLMRGGISISIFGAGWGELPEFASAYRGDVTEWDEFELAIKGCAGLVYCWPRRQAHAMEMSGKPVLYRKGQDVSQFLRDAKKLLAGAGRGAPAMGGGQVTLGEVIAELIG